MNEFDLLSAAINAAIKHAKHNQKLHGNRSGGYVQAAMDFNNVNSVDSSSSGANSIGIATSILTHDERTIPESEGETKRANEVSEEKYKTLGDLMHQSFTENEQTGVQLYQDSDYLLINGTLSGRETSKGQIHYANMLIGYIDQAMNKSAIPRDTTLYRGAKLSKEEIERITATGTIINKAGYTSATTSIQVASMFAGAYDEGVYPVVFHIKAPAGTRALHVKNAAKTEHAGYENEILVHRNSNMIVRGSRVQTRDGIEGRYDVLHIDVELLPEDTA